jgi:hypothetical protein
MNKMNEEELRSGTVFVIATVVFMLMTGVASATNLTLERNAYADELDRCIDLIRPSVQAGDVGKITYDVQEIDLRGPWYEFEISVSVEGENGAMQLDGYKVGCKSNRWIDASKLQARRNIEKLPLTMELVASK